MHNIVFLMNGAKRPRGGELLTLSLIRNLRRDLFTPILICGRESAEAEQLSREGVRTFKIAVDDRAAALYLREIGLKNSWRTLNSAYRLARSRTVSAVSEILKESRADLVYCADSLSKLIGGIAARRFGIKAVGHCHDDLRNYRFGYPLRLLNLLLLHKIVAVSDAVYEAFGSKSGISSKAVMIHNGVDTNRFDPKRIENTSLAKQLKIPKEAVVVAAIGTLDKNRGYGLLLEAVSELRSRGSRGAVVLIIGDGPDREALRYKSNEAGLGQHVKFLGFRPDIPELLKLADILVMPTLFYESYGLVAAEAMAMEVPVIGSRLGGMPELIVDGETGLLFPPGNLDALSNALEQLIGNPELRMQMGCNGRIRVKKKFTFEQSVEKVEQVFLDLVRHGPGC